MDSGGGRRTTSPECARAKETVAVSLRSSSSSSFRDDARSSLGPATSSSSGAVSRDRSAVLGVSAICAPLSSAPAIALRATGRQLLPAVRPASLVGRD